MLLSRAKIAVFFQWLTPAYPVYVHICMSPHASNPDSDALYIGSSLVYLIFYLMIDLKQDLIPDLIADLIADLIIDFF